MNKLIPKLQHAGSITLPDNKAADRANYQQWQKMSILDKAKRRFNIAKTQFEQSSSPIYNSLKAIFGGFDPNNPDLIYGEVYTPGIRNPKQIISGINTVKNLKIPNGYTFIKQLNLKTKDGFRTVHQVKDPNGKFKILEDLDFTSAVQQPKVNLKNYSGEKLTGNEEGFEQWAWSRTPETDHFANLSHGLNNENLLPIMNREFEALPNGSRVDLGEIFSSDSSSNLLQYVRRNNKRIKMVLPKNPEEVVSTNEYGTRGADAARIFNEQLDKLLDIYGYSPNAVPRAVYNQGTNTLIIPKLSFIKLYKKGNKIPNFSFLSKKNYGINI